MSTDPLCPTCDGDGYVDIVDGWGGVVGPAPCPDCTDTEGYFEAHDHYLPPDRERADSQPEETTT